MKERLIYLKNRVLQTKNAPIVAYSLIAIDMSARNLVHAAEATELVEMIIQIIANLIMILGAILAIIGVVHYATAQSEGDGPAKQKAVMQIAAGSMVALLSMILKNKAGDIASYAAEDM